MELYSPDTNETPSALGHMLQGIQHFGMTTPDLKKSLTFYIDILGGRLAVGGDGFYGSEMHNLLFQLDEMRSKEGEHSPEYYGVPDLRRYGHHAWWAESIHQGQGAAKGGGNGGGNGA